MVKENEMKGCQETTIKEFTITFLLTHCENGILLIIIVVIVVSGSVQSSMALILIHKILVHRKACTLYSFCKYKKSFLICFFFLFYSKKKKKNHH